MGEPEHEDREQPAPGAAHGAEAAECVEWCPICRAADVLRATTTPEVREQWEGIQREALLTLRAIVDHYTERVSESPPGPRRESDETRRATPLEEIPPVE
jgi:hypothetical protein